MTFTVKRVDPFEIKVERGLDFEAAKDFLYRLFEADMQCMGDDTMHDLHVTQNDATGYLRLEIESELEGAERVVVYLIEPEA